MLISLDGLTGRTGGKPSTIFTIHGLKKSETAVNKCSRSATVVARSNTGGKVISITLVLQGDVEDEICKY